ncbi:MAG TPA: lamin tail domain-containing protein [Verrucomicrobiae bacterium]|jgi:hypothetical protein|nr:lamin tail domain-containing protein [Verrucomicrobiae bacterium]
MRRTQIIFHSTITAILLATLLTVNAPLIARADPTNAPSLVISQVKVTSSNGQFVTLYNAGQTALDMSKYELEYFNSYDLTKATSSKLVSLSGMLPPHGYFMVNDGALLLCYQLTVDSVSLDFSSTAGMIEVLAFNQSNPGNSVTPTLQDYIGWSKTAASGVQTLPSSTNAFLQRQPVDTQNNPAISAPGAGTWQTVQPDTGNACNLVSSSSGGTVSIPTGLSQLLPGTEPPATIAELGGDDQATSNVIGLPLSDIGLMAPEITEVLPNPDGTGNDASDEFIELYNPNTVSFDLGGFGLQVGTTTLHSFTFPNGTSLPARSFTAFYSADTHLSLSNTGGQAKLLDPFGTAVATSDVYSTAKDGQSWDLANGKWYWTTSPTPGAANVIHQPIASSKTSAKSGSSKTKTAKGIAQKAKTLKTKSLDSTNASSDTVPITPIHPWTLALVAGLALLYGVYEYRTDLANRIHRLRRHLRAR